MICPHCKKPIERKISKKTIAEAKKLRKEGYSLRDIERILHTKGVYVSFTTLSRHGV